MLKIVSMVRGIRPGKKGACTSQKENVPKKIRLQDTRKIGCHAHVEVKHYIVFPEYTVESTVLLRYQ